MMYLSNIFAIFNENVTDNDKKICIYVGRGTNSATNGKICSVFNLQFFISFDT